MEALLPLEAASLAECREVLESGYTLEYEGCASHIYEDVLSEEDCRLVRDALDLHSVLQSSLVLLGASCSIPASNVAFDGFDGNHETAHLGYAEFLVSRRRLWTNVALSNSGLNSHSERIARYREMLPRWVALGSKRPLTAAEIANITA